MEDFPRLTCVSNAVNGVFQLPVQIWVQDPQLESLAGLVRSVDGGDQQPLMNLYANFTSSLIMLDCSEKLRIKTA